MWDVIEHLRDPVEVIREIGEHLKADGLIFIETGNFENWKRIVAKDKWGLYLFDHQFYFSPSSLKRVLQRAGFDGFCLVNTDRQYPSFHLKQLLGHPLGSMISWLEYIKARAKWPEHGDMNVMVAVARRKFGLTNPST